MMTARTPRRANWVASIGVAAMIVAGMALAVPAPEVEALLAGSR